jgi:hypothetical protein
VAGILALVLRGAWRLGVLAVEGISRHPGPAAWSLAAVWMGAMLYFEGYRGFQRSFSPRAAARARWLNDHPRPLLIALAPLFCMGLVHATRRRLITSWVVLGGIAGLVVGMRLVPQPWRGLLDAGVAAALVYGAGTVVVLYVTAGSRPPRVELDLPGGYQGISAPSR